MNRRLFMWTAIGLFVVAWATAVALHMAQAAVLRESRLTFEQLTAQVNQDRADLIHLEERLAQAEARLSKMAGPDWLPPVGGAFVSPWRCPAPSCVYTHKPGLCAGRSTPLAPLSCPLRERGPFCNCTPWTILTQNAHAGHPGQA